MLPWFEDPIGSEEWVAVIRLHCNQTKLTIAQQMK